MRIIGVPEQWGGTSLHSRGTAMRRIIFLLLASLIVATQTSPAGSAMGDRIEDRA